MFRVGFKKYLGIFICSFIFFTVGIVNVCEASMVRSMSWTGSDVIISCYSATSIYKYKSILYTYSKSDQQGLTLDIKASGKIQGLAMASSTNSSNKSAYAEHYEYDGDTILRKKIYYRNKGNGYNYDD